MRLPWRKRRTGSVFDIGGTHVPGAGGLKTKVLLRRIWMVGEHSTLRTRVIVRVATAIAIAFVGVGISQFIARANYVMLYATSCDGDWQNADKAAGGNDGVRSAPPSEFIAANSAVLDPRQANNLKITCGTFAGQEVSSTQLVSAKVNLMWVFRMADTNKSAELIEPTNSSTTTTTITDVGAQTSTDTVPTITPTTTDSKEPSGSETPVVLPIEKPVSEPAPEPVPIPAPTPTPEPPTSWVNVSPFASLFAPVAHADGGQVPQISASLMFDGLNGFLDVQYSLDGASWTSFDNANLDLPVKSWDDLKNLQIRILNLRTGEDLPFVYLRGMGVEVRYVPTDGDSLANQELEVPDSVTDASSTPSSTSLLDDLTGVLKDGVDRLLGDNNNQAEPPQPQQSQPTQPPQPQHETTVPLLPPIPLKQFTFAVSGNEFLPEGKGPQAKLSVEDNGHTLAVSGSCDRAYAVVMMFANPNDWGADPSKALVNRATLCENKTFSFQIKSSGLAQVFIPGDYYLLTADQNEGRSPWVPQQSVWKVQIQESK